MNDPMVKLEDDIQRAMQNTAMGIPKRNGSDNVTNKSPSTVISEATNQDSARTTRSMLEHHTKIAEGLEKQIAEANEVRETVIAYIGDLSTALSASKATIEVLTKK